MQSQSTSTKKQMHKRKERFHNFVFKLIVSNIGVKTWPHRRGKVWQIYIPPPVYAGNPVSPEASLY